MRPNSGLIFQVLLSVSILAPAVTMADAQTWQYPLIEHYGKVRDYPNALARPDPKQQHRLLLDVTKGAKSPEQLTRGLEGAARLANLYALAGVPKKNLHIVAVVHGKATAGVLDNAHYRAKFDMDNPNTPLLHALADAGVDVFVCGQALAHNDFESAWVDSHVKVVLGAFAALAKYQQAGYVLLPN